MIQPPRGLHLRQMGFNNNLEIMVAWRAGEKKRGLHAMNVPLNTLVDETMLYIVVRSKLFLMIPMSYIILVFIQILLLMLSIYKTYEKDTKRRTK